jgi:hypothetical protein
VVAGVLGKTNVIIEETTNIVKAQAATISDIATGNWLEVKGSKSADSSSIQATSIRISDEQPSNGPEGGLGSGPQGGPGGPDSNNGGPGGGQRGGPGGDSGTPPRQVPVYRGSVESIDGNSIVILLQSPGGTTKATINVDSNTEIVKLTKATKDIISTGGQVTVIGENKGNSEVIARIIEIKE